MKLMVEVALLSIALSIGAQLPKAPAANSKNHFANTTPSKFQARERLKRSEFKDEPIDASEGMFQVDGMWVPESKDPAKDLLFPEQVHISCVKSTPMPVCRETTLPLGTAENLISIMAIDEKEWSPLSWDERGLMAYVHAIASPYLPLADRCLDHELIIEFGTGAVSTIDIPVHTKGCEAFTTTNSYRLVRGNYYVDLSPGNDGK